MRTPLSAYVHIRGRFHRSVHLATDWASRRLLNDYLLTPTLREIAGHVLAELARAEGTRAWSITGPYGTGKSAFALFLADTLAASRTSHPSGRELRSAYKWRHRPLVATLVTAERGPLAPLLFTALADAVRGPAPRTAARLRTAARGPSVAGSELARLVVQAAEAVREGGAGGILLVIDELGKFLEYAAAGHAADVFLLQQLAEAAARSKAPLVLVTILHSAFADYLPVHDELRRAEWQKVQGRFRDIPFQIPAEQVLALVASAVRRRAPRDLETAWRNQVLSVVESDPLAPVRARLPLAGLAAGCAPLHPVTALLLWPVFRSKGAQNERSLFSFLTSQEPFGFQEFLRTAAADAERAPFYSVPQLYDYLSFALGLGAFRGDHARKWALIDAALTRLPPNAPPACPAVVKAVGLISMYGPTVGLTASRDLLKLVCGDPGEVERACDMLERASILILRRHLGGFVLWEGSDLDLDAAFAEAKHRVAGRSLAARLRQNLGSRGLVAKAHYVETGTLRYFDVDYIDAAAGSLTGALVRPTAADGRLLFAIRPSGESLTAARTLILEESKALAGTLVIVGVPLETAGLEDALVECEAWAWVASHTPALQSDDVARQEVRARLNDARERLQKLAGPLFGLSGYRLDPSACIWIHAGTEVSLSGGSGFQKWLSQLCDAMFSSAPRLRNELLNRQTLSSAASAARRVLLERMLTRAAEPRLGIEGMPPEASMYESMLRAGGFHREVDGRWKLAPPLGDWRPVWDALLTFTREARHTRRPITELYVRLKAPPFGLRDGPIPVLLAAALQLYREAIALYEGGVFVPSLRIEVLERLMRRPEDFELKSHRLTRLQRATLRALEEIVSTSDESQHQGAPASLLPVARALVLFVAHLPPYARQTRRVPADAAAVRDRILLAADPAKLVFEELPAALGIPLTDPKAVQFFVVRLRECLRALGRAYPQLLDEIESQIRGAFGLRSAADDVQRRLQARAAPLLSAVADGRLQVFVREATRESRGRDWRELLARAANGGVPPSHWKDADAAAFQVRLTEIASDFQRLEELVAEQRRSGAPCVVRIALLDGSSHELKAVVPLRDEFDPVIDDAVQRALQAVAAPECAGAAGEQVQLEVLARLAAAVLRQRALGEIGARDEL